MDIWKGLLAYFFIFIFSHIYIMENIEMHQCHWYENPTIDLTPCNLEENIWRVISSIYLWLLYDGMDEQNIGEKSFSMKLHILANVDYMTLNSCIFYPNFFLDISHLYSWEVFFHAFTMDYKSLYFTTTKIQNNDVWFLDTLKKRHYLDYNVILNGAY